MPDNGKQNTHSMDDEKLFDDIDEIESEEDEAAIEEAIRKEEAEQAAKEAVDPFEALQIENAELKDRLLRNLAEMQNMRKRADREKSEATLYAATNFARDILTVSDNLSRALETMDDEAREKADDSVKNMLEGIALTRRELHNTLHKHNIISIDPLGEKFDPNKHQAMYEVPDPNAINGTVAQVIQTGYMIGDRVLRPAMVGVVKSDKK